MRTIFIVLTTIGILFSGEFTATFRVDWMMCAMSCPQKINDSLNGVDGIQSCKVDFESKTATVIFDNEKLIVIQFHRPLLKAPIIK